jgi:hypothetical protein
VPFHAVLKEPKEKPMKGVVYDGPGRRSWTDHADPKITAPTDAVVRIDAVTICGTDLHILRGELPARGITAGVNRFARLCTQQKIWSVFAKKKGLARRAGPPVHDDLVRKVFTADAPDRLWLTDITEHPTAVSLRDQGRLLRPDRWLLDRLEDDDVIGGVGVA